MLRTLHAPPPLSDIQQRALATLDELRAFVLDHPDLDLIAVAAARTDPVTGETTTLCNWNRRPDVSAHAVVGLLVHMQQGIVRGHDPL